MTLTFFKGRLENTLYAFSKFQKAFLLIFYTFVTLIGCWGPFLNQNNEKKPSKNEKSKKVNEFDFLGILKKMTCGTSLIHTIPVISGLLLRVAF